MRFLIRLLLTCPETVARYVAWLAPLFARIVVGYVFLLRGWINLHALHHLIRHFTAWGIPDPQILAPFVAGSELVGGAFLLAGLLTRISAGALVIMMIVAIRVAKWSAAHSVQALLGLDETDYLALFLWLAIAGAGPVSLDHLLQRGAGHPHGPQLGEEPVHHHPTEAHSGAA